MIYRVKLNAANAANVEGASMSDQARHVQATKLGTPERWFVGQIESRYNQILAQNLPLDWAHLARHLAQRLER